MGNNSQTTQQYQQSQFDPWGITIPGLTNLANQLNGMTGQTGLTPAQQQGLSGIWSAANALPNQGPQASGVVSNLLNSSTAPQQNILSSAYNTTQNALQPYYSSSYTNPFNVPGFSTAINTANRDITNQIEGQFAAAGRPISGNDQGTQALARGLAQGDSSMIANEFNALTGQQQNAINMGQGAANATSSGLAQLSQIPYQNQLAAVSAMAGIPGLYMSQPQAVLQAANTAYGQPYANTMAPLTQLAGMAGLGGTSSGSGTSTTTQPMNPFTTALGATMGLGALGKSDRRLKTDIKKVGRLDNDLPVYSYRFKADPDRRTHIGVMAQDVEKRDPGAVHDVGLWKDGPTIKMVDYNRATGGLWQPSAMAA